MVIMTLLATEYTELRAFQGIVMAEAGNPGAGGPLGNIFCLKLF